jgi:hypothetical protein
MFDSQHSPILIEYRPGNRNTYIRINQNGEIQVRTPLQNESAIRRILKLREHWIRSKLDALDQSSGEQPVLGKDVRFRGENYPLEQLPRLHEKVAKAKSSMHIEKHYHQFYRDEAMLTLPSRVAFYARKMNLHPKEIRFKRLRSRWGSCDTKGVVTFNTLMMQLSYIHIDYIIVHELAHLRHMNHSKHFHALVGEYLDGEKQIRRELRGIRPV